MPRDNDDDLIRILDDADDTPDRRDIGSVDSFGSESLDRRAPGDEYYAAAADPERLRQLQAEHRKRVERETRLADDGSYDLSDDEPAPSMPKPRKKATPAVAVVPAADAEFIEDRPCHNCGYNLIGLPPGTRCPECGAQPPISMGSRPRTSGRLVAAPDSLQSANPRWLGQLALGLQLIFWTVIVNFCIGFASNFIPLPAIVWRAIETAGVLSVAAGFWLLSMPDPSGVDAKQKLRLAMRVLAVAGVASAGFNFLIVLLDANGPAGGGGGGLTITPLLALQMGLEIVWLAATPVTAFYLRHLAIRAYTPEVQARAESVGLILSFSLGLLGLGVLLLIATIMTTGSIGITGALGLGCAGVLLGLVFLAGTIMYVLLLAEALQMIRHAASPSSNGNEMSPDQMRQREAEILAARRRKQTIRIGR